MIGKPPLMRVIPPSGQPRAKLAESGQKGDEKVPGTRDVRIRNGVHEPCTSAAESTTEGQEPIPDINISTSAAAIIARPFPIMRQQAQAEPLTFSSLCVYLAVNVCGGAMATLPISHSSARFLLAAGQFPTGTHKAASIQFRPHPHCHVC